MDSNHRRRSQQIYSLSHLTALETPHCNIVLRAGGGIRTPDQLITNQLLWPTELHRQTNNFFRDHRQNLFFVFDGAKVNAFFVSPKKLFIFFLFYFCFSFRFNSCTRKASKPVSIASSNDLHFFSAKMALPGTSIRILAVLLS